MSQWPTLLGAIADLTLMVSCVLVARALWGFARKRQDAARRLARGCALLVLILGLGHLLALGALWPGWRWLQGGMSLTAILGTLVILPVVLPGLAAVEARPRDMTSALREEVAQRHEAQADAERAQRRFRLIMDQIPGPVLLKDRQGRFSYLNQQAAQMIGLPEEQILGRTDVELLGQTSLMSTDWVDGIRTQEHQVIEQRQVVRFVRAFEHEGVIRHLATSRFPIVNPDGSVEIGMMAVDITDRVEAEQRISELTAELRARNALLNRILDATSEAILAIDPAGTLLLANPAFYRLMGGQSQTDQTLPFSSHVGVYDVDQKRLLEDSELPLRRALRGARNQNRLLWIKNSERAEGLWLQVAADPFFNEHNQLAGVVSIAVDVTQRLNDQAALEELNTSLQHKVEERTAALRQTVQELEAFDYSIAHDLRSPVRAIESYSQILLERHRAELSPQGQSRLERVRDTALRLGEMVDGLLRFSILGRAALQIEPVEPARLVRQVLEDLEPEIQRGPTEITVGALPPCRADAVLLSQVWFNLMANALKFSRGREPRRIELGATTTSQGAIAYFVRDNGVGFDPKYAQQLFGVFQRLCGEAEFEGTGLGLALAQRIIMRHEGTIWAEAAPNRGACFFFTIGG